MVCASYARARRVLSSPIVTDVAAPQPTAPIRPADVAVVRLSSLLFHLPMLFQELVEQHRVHRFVAHGMRLAVPRWPFVSINTAMPVGTVVPLIPAR